MYYSLYDFIVVLISSNTVGEYGFSTNIDSRYPVGFDITRKIIRHESGFTIKRNQGDSLMQI